MRGLGSFTICACVATPLVAAPLPDNSIETVRISEVVASMQTAIERADSGAYMAAINPSDEVLLTEHRAWFAELSISPVIDLRVAIDPSAEIVREDNGSVVAPLVYRWQVPGEDEPRRYEMPAVFEPIGTPSGLWHFVGRDWDIALTDTPGIRIYCDEAHRDIAELALERAPVLRDAIAVDMGIDPSGGGLHEVVVKIFPEMHELQASIYPSYTAGISGWNEPGESIKILGRDEMGLDRLDPLLAHEIGHAVSFEYGPKINLAPWWSLEGIAEVAAGLFRDAWESKNRRIVRLAHSNNLREWHLLADFKGEAVNHAMHVYLQGWSMVDYIDRTFGKDARNAWFTRLGHGDTLDEASVSALSITFDELDTQWRASLMAFEREED